MISKEERQKTKKDANMFLNGKTETVVCVLIFVSVYYAARILPHSFLSKMDEMFEI